MNIYAPFIPWNNREARLRQRLRSWERIQNDIRHPFNVLAPRNIEVLRHQLGISSAKSID